jgi:transposase
VPDGERRSDGKGRLWRNKWEALQGTLWIVRTDAPWKGLPERFAPCQNCYRRFQQWVESGVFKQVIEALKQDLQEQGKVDMNECFINSSFSGAPGAYL